MGADGFVLNPDQPLGYVARCYTCGYTIYEDEVPNDEHRACATRYGGKIGVSSDADNGLYADLNDFENFEQR